MTHARATVVAAAVGLTIVGLLAFQAQRAESQEPGRLSALIERPEELNPDFPIVPVIPVPATAIDTGSFQLVGFTTTTHPGNRGILNLTLACQEEFESSRICSAEEIVQTVAIPEALGAGHAWVRSAEPTVRNSQDCMGWTSDSSQATGMAISVGPCTACYGGFRLRTCNEPLQVACCARMP